MIPKKGSNYFYCEAYISLNLSIERLQPFCMYHVLCNLQLLLGSILLPTIKPQVRMSGLKGMRIEDGSGQKIPQIPQC